LLDEVGQDWREETVIHGDLRWDNCQVVESRSDRPRWGITIVDWEAAGIGDPCWDVGTVFSQCLVFWLLSTPLVRDTAPEDLAGLARLPLLKMQPAIRSFWQSYASEMGLDADARRDWLLRSVRYSGARLVQTACEQMQSAKDLTADILYLLQLSLNVLQRPMEAAVQLMGIPILSGDTR
jgi:aminoglycoside phosphotransferase (APT) family kinase protein